MSIKKTFYNLASLFIFGAFIFVGITIFTPEHEARAALSKRVFLTSGTTWTVPADFSSTNTIETIGGGGTGGTNSGGGGGAYASEPNISLTPGASVTYQIGSAGSDTVFNSTATTCAGSPTPSVCADGGVTGVSSSNGAGGTTANSIGTTKYAGGTGADGSGGGAAGPHGAGVGAAIDGGAGDAGFGGAGGYAGVYEAEPPAFCAANGGNGNAGTEFSNLPAYGSGGGGGYGTVSCTSGSGGAFGGGGGGSGASAGGSGLIVITYTSTETGSTSLAKFKIKGGSFLIRGGRVQIR